MSKSNSSRREFLFGRFRQSRDDAPPTPAAAPRQIVRTERDRPLPTIVRLPTQKPLNALTFLESLSQNAAESQPLVAPLGPNKRLAMITEYDCLAHNGSFCSVCRERCPIAGAIVVHHGRPQIAEDICTGCGDCQAVCPAPANAIVLVPAGAGEHTSKNSHD